MRLKSAHASVANQRIKRTCVANIFMLCLLSAQVWSYANIKHHRFVRQLNAEKAVNYEDTAMTNSYHRPHFTENRAVVVQLFEWKFVDVAAECRNFLGPQGYAGVQLSPVLEHTVVKASELNHPWWERYEVVSYRLASRSGDESEFWSMSRICNEHGVRIYADVILNHMAAPLHFVGVNETENEDFIINTLLETNVNISQMHYSNVTYTQQDFHPALCMVLANAQDAHELRNCQLNGHPDLDHSRGNVQQHIVEMLNKFIDMGVAGFRIDTAKYMWPIDLKNILKQVKNLNTEFNFNSNSRPFVYHDVFDLGLDTVSKTEYSTYGVVSEYLYAAELSNVFNDKVPLSSLINWGPALGFLAHDDSLVFIDSHDTQRGLPLVLGNNQMLTYKKRFKYIMANVFMLVHPYGAIKRIMSSYYFTDANINQGPPVEEANEEEIRSPKFNEQNQCTRESGWVCEHRWPALVNMLKVANYFKVPDNKEDSVIYFQTNGPNQVAFCRGHKAFVAINNDNENDFVKEVYACLEPGVYCDVVTGGKKDDEEECHGKRLEINEHGVMQLELAVADDDNNGEMESEVNNEEEEESSESGKIESYGIIVIYVETKIKPMEKLASDKNDEELQTAEKPDEVNDNQSEVGEKEMENKNNIEETEIDKNGTKENEEEINGDDSNQKDEEDNEDMGNPNESEDDINTEQPEEDVTATRLEQDDEEKEKLERSAAAEDDLEEPTDETIEEKLQENDDEATNTDNEEANEVSDLSKEKDLNENEGKQQAARSIENGEPEDETKTEDNNVEEQEENSSNETELQHSKEKDKEEVKEEVGEQQDLVQINSAETEAENVVEEPEIEQEAADVTEQNQPRNMDAEEQLEKPSIEIVDDIKASDAVTAKVQDIQTAGLFSKPQGEGNNG